MVHPSIISHGWIEDVQFLASSFQHIRSLKLPGSELSSCTWGPRSLRIALSIDSFIFFANIRPYYLWTYFGQTLLFSSNQGLLFWDTLSNAVSYCYYTWGSDDFVRLSTNDSFMKQKFQGSFRNYKFVHPIKEDLRVIYVHIWHALILEACLYTLYTQLI